MAYKGAQSISLPVKCRISKKVGMEEEDHVRSLSNPSKLPWDVVSGAHDALSSHDGERYAKAADNLFKKPGIPPN